MAGAPNPGDYHCGLGVGGGGCSQYLFFHLQSGEEETGGIYLGRRCTHQPSLCVGPVVSPNKEKGKEFSSCDWGWGLKEVGSREGVGNLVSKGQTWVLMGFRAGDSGVCE